MALTREQILAARKNRKPERLEVPEWGGEVFVKVLTAAEQASLSDGVDPKEAPIRVLLYALVDEDGQRIFTDEDGPALAEHEFPVIMRVFAEAAKLNGLSSNELEEAVASFGRSQDGS